MALFSTAAFGQGPATITQIVYPGSVLTTPTGINNQNQVTGKFLYQGSGVMHGFLRTSAGAYTQFDCPNGADTHPSAINFSGTIVGTCGVPNTSQGFVRDAAGTFTLINFPGAVYTVASGVNDAGQVTGHYAIASGTNFIRHGFIRDPGGTITSFDVPNSSDTIGIAINNAGQIAGSYNGGFNSTFLRAPNDTFTTFSTPGPPVAINSTDRIFGFTTGAWPAWFGDPGGVVLPLTIPSSHRTVLAAINDLGIMTGQDWDTAFGFLSLPCATASINPTSRTHGPGNEAGSVAVTPPPGCSWSAASYADWITHPGGISTGAASQSYIVLPNNSGASRSGTINIAGQIFIVTQPAGTCSYSLAGSHTVPPFGGSNTITISTSPECGWVASAVQPQPFAEWQPLSWIGIDPPGSGFGDGSVTYNALACSGCSASILIGNQSFGVTTASSTFQIYVQNDATRAITAWYMNGSSQVATAALSASVPGWHLAATADFDRNGVRDLIWQSDSSGLATVWFMGGPSGNDFLSWGWLGDGSGDWRIVAAYDFDDNGYPDLIWQNQESRAATIWYMTLVNGFPEVLKGTYLSSPQEGWRIVGAAFVPPFSQSPGALAILWQHDTSGDVTIWIMDPNSQPRNSAVARWRYLIFGFGPDWRVIGISKSGTELYWQNESTRAMTVWHMPYLILSNQLSGWEFLTPSATLGGHAIAR